MYPKKCKKCNEHRISIISLLAYSATGEVRCDACGAVYTLNKVVGYFYLMLEGGGILFSAIASVYSFSAWPLILTIIVAGLVRVLLLPVLFKEITVSHNRRSKNTNS